MATVKSIPITIATTSASSPPTVSASLGTNRQSASFASSSTATSTPTPMPLQSSALSPSDVNITTVSTTSNKNSSNRLSESTNALPLPPSSTNVEPGLKSAQEQDEATDNEDLSQPLRTNNNEHLALQSSSSSNDNESKTFRKSRRKNLFKSIFCCFSTSMNRSKSIDYSKGNAYAPSPNNNNNNNNAYNNLNNQASLNNGGSSSNASGVNVNTNNNGNYINSANFTNIDATGSSSSNQYPITSVSPHQVNHLSSSTTDNATPQHHYTQQQQQQQQQQHQQFSDKNSLLPPIRPSDIGKKCLIIDLDETLVHSSFKQVNNADFVVPVEIDGVTHQVYVLKRPFVDEFLKRMGELFECVLFTASLAKYADPVADLLDKWGVFRARLFREACVFYRGNYVKDLSRLGRDLSKVIILDNSPASYIFHPDNAVPCTSWFDDMHDCELMELIPHFERLAATDNIYALLKPQASPTNTMNGQLSHGQMMATSRFAQPAATSLYIHHQHLQLQQQQQQQQHQQQQNDENQQVPNLPQAQSLIYQVQPPQYNTNNLNINNPLTNLTNNSSFNSASNASASADAASNAADTIKPHSIPIHQLRSKN